jgi:hypothetical protein
MDLTGLDLLTILSTYKTTPKKSSLYRVASRCPLRGTLLLIVCEISVDRRYMFGRQRQKNRT